MKRVSSAPGALSELGASAQGPASKSIGAHPQTFKSSNVLANGQNNKRGNALVASAMALDAPPDTTIGSPAPQPEISYALASRGISFLECLPSIEMKDAPSVDLATCMATPVIPDEGPGAEVRQRAAAIATQAEEQLRLRYAEEITARVAVRFGRITSSNRKRSLDDLDLHEALQELESSGGGALNNARSNNNNNGINSNPSNENIDHKQEEQKKKYEEELRGPQKSNVVPFKRPSTAAVIVANVSSHNNNKINPFI
ncbi:hypothetical protein Ndes2526B_g05049 [Nannochloris sp. 'desiccata']